jgi:hypothetical protein
MTQMIGMAPTKEGVSAGASYPWIQENFHKCPDDANDEVIQRYARAYLWYVVSRVLFSDATGTNAAFMWLKLFAGWEFNLSWGTAALAYLYRQVLHRRTMIVFTISCYYLLVDKYTVIVVCGQLDEACCRTGKGASIGGCMLLLSIWSWCRLPVGRPIELKHNDWPETNDPLRQPTWAFMWDCTEPWHGDTVEAYERFTSEIDALTPEKVVICFVSLCSHIPLPCCSHIWSVVLHRLNGSHMDRQGV